MKTLKLIGVDSWDRPVYRDQNGRIYKDVNLGQGEPSLHTAADNDDMDSEPDMPLREEFTIVNS